jgi:hypothetical protein
MHHDANSQMHDSVQFIASPCQREDQTAFVRNWFFMTPSIATKFQYVNSLLFSFSLTTLDILMDYFNTTDPLHVSNLM